MKRLISIIYLCVLFIAKVSLSVTPMESSFDVSINSTVHANINSPSKHAGYNQQVLPDGFALGDAQLTTSAMTDSRCWSSTSKASEQIASNEYILSLTLTSMGQLLTIETPRFGLSNLDDHSSHNVYDNFLMLGLPSQPLGEASTILEYLVTLPGINNRQTYNQANIGIFAKNPDLCFIYDSFLDTQELPAAELKWSEFTEKRRITKSRSSLTYVSETINLFAELDTDEFVRLSAKSGF